MQIILSSGEVDKGCLCIGMMMHQESILNQRIADKLRQAADLLEQQEANPFRINAYRRAADTVSGLQQDLREIVEQEGVEGLLAIPSIGESIAGAICEMIRTGQWSQLERWRGALDPEHLFQTIPGIGPNLARAIHGSLHVDTLEALEIAAHDGRLETVPGVGPRRAAMLRATLAAILQRPRGRWRPVLKEPDVAMLLDVDRDYCQKARLGTLPCIAPRRFNPEGKTWLPVLHTQRGSWHFTLLYSNSARAHDLRRTHDWVVVYFSEGDQQEGQCTVVTETRGQLLGKRVVRGREEACRAYYADVSSI
jgi:DNA polymerase (family X)